MIHFNTVTPDQFFQNLSKADGKVFYGYNKGFEIDRPAHNVFQVREASKGVLNPFKVQHDDQRKLATANNLADLFTMKANGIVQKTVAGTDAAQIVRVLKRYKAAQTKGMTPGHIQGQTQQAYQRAIAALNEARANHDLNTLKKVVSPRGKTQWTSKAFVEKLAKGWITSRPNFKFHLKQERNGEITPYTSRKLFWIEKLIYGKATSALEKKAMMQNLEALLIRQMPRIEGSRLNATAIEANVERLAGRMTSNNMTDAEKGEIDAIVGRLKGRLQQAQISIDKDRGSDPLWNIFWGVKWTVLAPVRLTKWVAWDNIGYPLARVSVGGLYLLGAWTANKTGVATAARKVHAWALTGWGGLKTAASYPVAFAKGTYNNVISPTVMMAGLVARGISSLASLPVQALNSLRQVTA